MLAVYYSYYTPVSDSIPEICAQEHALGRALLLHGLEELCGLSWSEEQLGAALAAGPQGKPCLANHPDVHFNITHCDRLAACAFSDRPVGVDAELPGYFAEVLINRALSADEKKTLADMGHTEALRREWFFRFWTLKEACVKMTGTGVNVPLQEISFSFGLPPSETTRTSQTCNGRFPASRQVPEPESMQTSRNTAQEPAASPGTQILRWLPETECTRDSSVICSSDSGVRCFQKTLETGHILSVCASQYASGHIFKKV